MISFRFHSFALGLGTAVVAVGCAAPTDGDPLGESRDEVKTAACPASLDASFAEMKALTVKQIEQAEGFVIPDDDAENLEKQIGRLKAVKSFSTHLVLDRAQNAECFYKATGAGKKTTAKFYTTKGKNILRVDAADGKAKEFSFYVTVTTYAKDAWTTASGETAGIVYREQDSEAAFRPRFIGRSNAVSLAVSPTAPATVEASATKFVRDNAGEGKAFPDVDSGEDGLKAYLLNDAAARRTLAFAKLWEPGSAKLGAFAYDPAKHLLVVVRTTFDEEDIALVAIDRASGKGALLTGRMGVVDAEYHLGAAKIKQVLPGFDTANGIDHMDLIDALVKGSREVALTP